MQHAGSCPRCDSLAGGGLTRGLHVGRAPQAEFTPLAEWVRERTLFDLISCVGFFRNYLTGRCFRRWHKVSGQPTSIYMEQHGGRHWRLANVRRSAQGSVRIPTACRKAGG